MRAADKYTGGQLSAQLPLAFQPACSGESARERVIFAKPAGDNIGRVPRKFQTDTHTHETTQQIHDKLA